MSREQAGDPHPLLDHRPEGAYFIGDLQSMQVEVEKDRIVKVTETEYGYQVDLLERFGGGAGVSTAEFGGGPDLETAVRYAFGAYID